MTYFDSIIAEPILSLDVLVHVLEKFDQAERDYLCELYKQTVKLTEAVAILLRHMEFLLSLYRAVRLSKGAPEQQADVTEFLSDEAIRDFLQGIVNRGQGLLGDSNLLWQQWLDWELSLEWVYEERRLLTTALKILNTYTRCSLLVWQHLTWVSECIEICSSQVWMLQLVPTQTFALNIVRLTTRLEWLQSRLHRRVPKLR